MSTHLQAANGFHVEQILVMKSVSCVRLKASNGELEVLKLLRCMDFMAAFLMVQLRMRRLLVDLACGIVVINFGGFGGFGAFMRGGD
ncbi:hypothetical protein Sjap_012720 [Stephania japonica]|uniref:Uncharacterized protein n=1 Tax=Stephania japonica TaxID=461633 RepID=A0AAP0IWM4_9MAGN